MSGWRDVPVMPPELKFWPALIDEMPTKLVWEARLHFYGRIYAGEKLHRALLVDVWNWQTGRHVYIVPVIYESDMATIIKRHTEDAPDARRTTIHVLFPNELEQYLPKPTARNLRDFLA